MPDGRVLRKPVEPRFYKGNEHIYDQYRKDLRNWNIAMGLEEPPSGSLGRATRFIGKRAVDSSVNTVFGPVLGPTVKRKFIGDLKTWVEGGPDYETGPDGRRRKKQGF